MLKQRANEYDIILQIHTQSADSKERNLKLAKFRPDIVH